MSRRPNPLPRFYRWRTNLWHIPIMTVATVACASFSLLVSLVDKQGRAQHRIARFWARTLVTFAGSSLIVRGADNLHRQPVAVYASNHTSYMDTPVVLPHCPSSSVSSPRRNCGLSHS